MSKIIGVGMAALALMVSFRGFGMTPFKQALDQKKNAYVTDGLFTGGQAGSGSTLIKVRRSFSQKAQIERVIIDMGDKDAKPAQGEVGYFQASLDAKKKRVVLDLAQLKMTRMSEKQIKEVFKNSAYVASAEFTADPEDRSGSIVLNLKRPMKLEVFELKGKNKPARIVMDLSPAPTVPAKGQL